MLGCTFQSFVERASKQTPATRENDRSELIACLQALDDELSAAKSKLDLEQ
jgi:hypothetical protein